MTYQEEFEKAQADAEAIKVKFEKAYGRKLIDYAIQEEAARRGAIDVDLVMKLIDRSGCTADIESEVCLGIGAAVDGIVAAKPYLFPGKPKPTPRPFKRPRMYGG